MMVILILYRLTCYTIDFFRFLSWSGARPACSSLAWTRLAVGRVWKPSKCSCRSSALSKPCLGRELFSSSFSLASRPWQGPCALHGSLELKPDKQGKSKTRTHFFFLLLSLMRRQINLEPRLRLQLAAKTLLSLSPQNFTRLNLFCMKHKASILPGSWEIAQSPGTHFAPRRYMTAVANVTYYAPDNSTCGLPREDAWQVLRQVVICELRVWSCFQVLM